MYGALKQWVCRFKLHPIDYVRGSETVGFADSNYTQLTVLHEKHKDKGFETLAFPCNQFLKRWPGRGQAEEFACTRHKAKYPIFQKVE